MGISVRSLQKQTGHKLMRVATVRLGSHDRFHSMGKVVLIRSLRSFLTGLVCPGRLWPASRDTLNPTVNQNCRCSLRREAFPEAGPYRYAVFDRDATLQEVVVTFLKATRYVTSPRLRSWFWLRTGGAGAGSSRFVNREVMHRGGAMCSLLSPQSVVLGTGLGLGRSTAWRSARARGDRSQFVRWLSRRASSSPH
jgi:hypothetical protein